jgi:hypothetical protein
MALALPLLMARIATDDKHHAASADELTVLADALYAGADFHDRYPDANRIKASEYKRSVAKASSPRGTNFETSECPGLADGRSSS